VYVNIDVAMPTPASDSTPRRPTNAVSQADSSGSISSVPKAGKAILAIEISIFLQDSFSPARTNADAAR
jgi:hypothetical protein